jgi:type I restriction enzyme S subunit
MNAPSVLVGDLALNDRGAFKIGPFGSSLKKSELVSAGIPVVGIENVLRNELVKGFRRFITPQKFQELSEYEIVYDDILVTTMGTIGRSAVTPSGLGRAIFDSHLFRMRVDTNRVVPSYLCFALNSDHVAAQLTQKARGAIMEGLNTTILRECSIPLPSIVEQKRIAMLLGEACQLIDIRRRALQMSDEFLPAAFLQMFGDPRTNSKKLRTVTIGDALTLRSGEFLPASAMDSHGTCPVYGGNGINGFHSAHMFEARQIVIGRVGVYCGAVHYTQPNSWVTDNALYVAKQAPQFNDRFLVQLLRLLNLNRFADQAAQPLISHGRLEKVALLYPPKNHQDAFARIIVQHENLKAIHVEALRQAHHLFQALLHEAFPSR